MTSIKLSFDLKVEIGAREELKEERLKAFFYEIIAELLSSAVDRYC